ncbi:hypothetical protein [Spirosoma terrae]|uniref:Uncharacterized protein n=1 Tax=Spirosoma terrae TaxID=1968276 RepID=A0A6L9L4N7_9BACT|nr:hypothetical protein [Spirosoma terrae]NDU95410.1 hypothetical protein [Spirosoma terrae]
MLVNSLHEIELAGQVYTISWFRYPNELSIGKYREIRSRKVTKQSRKFVTAGCEASTN